MSSRTSSSTSWITPLRNILKLEETRGFDDSAVIGGLDRFTQRWAEAIGAHFPDSPKSEVAKELLESNYSDMSEPERHLWADQWLDLLEADPPKETATETANGAPGIDEPAPEPTPPKTSKYRPPPGGLTVDAPVDRLRGIDTKLAARFKRLDVSTVRDLLYLFPRRHLDYSAIAKISELSPGQFYTVRGTVWEARTITQGYKGKRTDTEAVLGDETGNVKVIWFGQKYLARTLKPNSKISISGNVDVFKGQLVFQSPEYDILDGRQEPVNTGRLVPVYPLTEGLTGRNVRRLAWQGLQEWLGGVEEFLPIEVLSRAHLMPLQDAILHAHLPDDMADWESARRRLAFDELFTLQLAVLARRHQQTHDVQGTAIEIQEKLLDAFFGSLPFQLTGAQRRCTDEILTDLRRGTPPMNRLLQGEVGSGKTVVAVAALLAVAAAGYQGAIMVPTEVLAEQHFQTVAKLLSGLASPVQEDNLLSVYLESLGRSIKVGLLTGSTRRPVKRELTRMASEGNLDLLIGTQALIQEGVAMPKLALAVADEQHRFGVMQRSALRERGATVPHTLIMSATPIPRTLSLTLYGDLDISTIDELPAGRQEVSTRWLSPERRPAAYGFLRKEVQAGRQGFVICPLVEESETIESKAATEEYRRLSQEVFTDLRLGLLHGRMSAKDKDSVMRQFRDGDLDILVSTAVVEVGIDVANATVMLIEGADRFGLAQLHQFRGRVGRGEHKSYCLLLSDTQSEVAKERLSALERIHDGFQLAEVDLELRGPGDFFGTRQSGLPNLRMAHLSDRNLLELARDEASRLREQDPDLAAPEHAALAARVNRFLDQVSTEAS
ncbi:MAG: ATP-dependent DNA helicase RecG [Chloroflexi bacterium]|nr:ATP-dependent DNA helicase RecG [Chloroflexota bacterium]